MPAQAGIHISSPLWIPAFAGMTDQVVSFFAMSQELVSQNNKLVVRKPRLYAFLLTSGFVLLGGIIGILVGAFLFTYLIPFWYHTEIDVEDHSFSEIAFVEFFYTSNYELFQDDVNQDNVILRTEDGKYFSYHWNKWQQAELSQVNLSDYPYNYRACDEWASPPPATYLRRTKDSFGFDFAHAIANSARCYILFPDGSLELWTRDYDAFSLFFIGTSSLFFGMLVGGILGKKLANRKVRAALELKIS